MLKIMNKIKMIVLICCIALLCGCDNKKCIKSHEEESTCTMMQCIPNGKTMICIPVLYSCNQTICDEYEEVKNN